MMPLEEVTRHNIMDNFCGTIVIHQEPYPSKFSGVWKDIFVYFKGSKNATIHFKQFQENNISEAELLAKAFSVMGEKVFELIEHEFVMVVFDVQKGTFYLARDRFGIEPLYYRFINNTLEFAQNFLFFENTKSAINQQVVFEYLTNNQKQYQSSTFHQSIQAVLPAHFLRIEANTSKSFAFWQPKFKGYQDEKNAIEQFKEYLFLSVERNLSHFQKKGSHLSGGLDSSSLTAIASEQSYDLATFYLNTHLPDTDESFYARLVANRFKTQHHELSPLNNIYETIAHLSAITQKPEQFILPATFHLAMAQKAQDLGIEVLMTGHDGDSVAGHGLGYLQALRADKNWQILNIQLRHVANNYNLSHLSSHWTSLSIEEKQILYLNDYWNKSFWKSLKTKDIKQLLSYFSIAKNHFGYLPQSFIAFVCDKIYQKTFVRNHENLLHNDFISEKSTANFSMQTLFEEIEKEISEQFQAVLSASFVHINEELFQIGQHYKHRYVFPFFDKNLVEASMAVSEATKFGNGKTRALIRKMMQNSLPKEILERGDKAEFSSFALDSCLRLWNENQNRFLENPKMWQYISQDKFFSAIKMAENPKIRLSLKTNNVRLLNRAMYLGIWLEI